MQPSEMIRIARKEFSLYLNSPAGYLFLATFVGVCLFVLFWGEAWFARNIADVRPLFEWMPLLLVFLSAALTMRMWSEEKRTQTLEHVLTLRVSLATFVLGKFLACWGLLGVALLLTLPLPISVAFFSGLDWGPVLAGYLAAMLLGAMYLAIGLFVSARTSSQIVSLILAALVSGAFYIVGSGVLTDLAGNRLGEWMRLIGSGSRFESITRGVIDLRDLVYSLSLAGVFLVLCAHSLNVQRFANRGQKASHGRTRLAVGLAVVNLLAVNVWLHGVKVLRVDVTEGNQYSLSATTENFLAQLREPLLVRGYFSSKTHPLLAPLVPQLEDLLAEYEVAGNGRVRVEIIDPILDPEAEDEANSKYGIRSVPFQVEDRYQSSLVNSYFDVLVSYGDEYEVIGFGDLIEVKVSGESSIDVQLRNPEFDITSRIRKVLLDFQSGGEVLASLDAPVEFVAYASSDDALPPSLAEYLDIVMEVMQEKANESDGKLSVSRVDPEAGDGSVAADLSQNYGFSPMRASLFDAASFYFYLTMSDGEILVTLSIPETQDRDGFERVLDTALKRFASGYLKSVALSSPQPLPPQLAQQAAQQGFTPNTYERLFEQLTSGLDVVRTDLADGQVPKEAEALLVVDPSSLGDVEVFAIDQFLMRGGTVLLSLGAYESSLTPQSISVSPRNTGLDDWLAHNGIEIGESLVMDARNSAFPVPVTRQVGGFSFQELQMLDYPYFVEVRDEGFNEDAVMVSQVPQVSMPWSSPIVVETEINAERQVTELLRSSNDAWLSTSTNVTPRFSEDGQAPFAPEGEIGNHLLGVMVEGRFDSFFAGKESPLLMAAIEEQVQTEAESEEAGEEGAEALDGAGPATMDTINNEAVAEAGAGVVASVIERSPESARLIILASNEFLSDRNLQIMGSISGMVQQGSLELVQNAVDYALEDAGLVSIRSRGHFNRTLPPTSRELQMGFEYMNYALALLGLGIVFLLSFYARQRRRREYASWFNEGVKS
ncbi:MAG: Gldg family protein [Gammaproteobacteria bacterium]|nr:Gldg family protein [Gammaproteobacteria bacterium]